MTGVVVVLAQRGVAGVLREAGPRALHPQQVRPRPPRPHRRPRRRGQDRKGHQEAQDTRHRHQGELVGVA